MGMRKECKNYESRLYDSGDTVRYCRLDLAPDAPWKCPDGCTSFELRIAAGGWTVGSLKPPPVPPEPTSVAEGTAAKLLDEAEEIINSAGAQMIDDLNKNNKNNPNTRWWQFWKK